MLDEKVKKSIQESVLCWLATTDEAGLPNCSPKEVFTFRGDREIVIANIASPQSVSNIQANKNVCVSFVHVFKQKGYKVKGSAKYITSESQEYEALFALLEPMVGNVFPVNGIILVSVNDIQPIIAPAYFIVPGTTQESQIKSAKQIYGV